MWSKYQEQQWALKIQVFCNVSISHHFEGVWCLQLHSQAVHEDESTVVLWNIRNYSLKRLESSVTCLWEFQILHPWVLPVTAWADDLDRASFSCSDHSWLLSQSLALTALSCMLICFSPLLSPKHYTICSHVIIIIHFNYFHIGTWSSTQIINLL